MRFTGLKKPIFGIFCGIIIGLSFLRLKSFLANELIGLLDNEVRSSCNCSLEYDSISMSFLPLRAEARNARIVSSGKTKLTFKKVLAYFSLQKLGERKILLNELLLIDGFSDGVGPDSETFKFIDYLSQPAPSKNADPDKLKIKLQSLKVKNSNFEESIGAYRLKGSGANLQMYRNSDDNFVLKPTIRSLQLVELNNTAPQTIKLGKVESEFVIHDGLVDFSTLRLKRSSSFIHAVGVIDLNKNNRIKAKADYLFTSNYLTLPDWFTFWISGNGEIGGRLAEPVLSGSMQLLDGHPLRMATENLAVEFTKLNGSFSAQLEPVTQVTISKLQANGPQGEMRLLNTFKLDRNLQGDFSATLSEVTLAAMRATEIKSTLNLKGASTNPSFNLSGTSSKFYIGDNLVKEMVFNLEKDTDRYNFKVNHSSSEFGTIDGRGGLSVKDGGIDSISDLRFTLRDFSFMPELKELQNSSVKRIKVNGEGVLNGPFDLKALSGRAAITVDSSEFYSKAKLTGEAVLTNGVINAQLTNESDSVDASLYYDLKAVDQSRLKVALRSFNPAHYAPQLECSEVDATLNYTFVATNLTAGKGDLNLQKIRLGCAPFTLSLTQPLILPFNNAALKLDSLLLGGDHGSINIGGSLSFLNGYDLKINADSQLQSFLGFIPDVDDMSGKLLANVSILGSLNSPSISGRAKLDQATVEMASANVSAEAINADIDLTGSAWTIKSLTGKLNGGEFSLFGTINPLAFNRSELDLKLEDISIVPFENAGLTFSGQLNLHSNLLGTALLSGNILVDSAEFERKLDIRTLIINFASNVFINKKKEGSGSLPELELDIKATAPRNILITTSWLTAELSAEASIAGTLANPQLAGNLETLSGWVLVKDKRFEITAGRIILAPNQTEPRLELMSETYARSQAGDNVMVILEAQGPLTAPSITLSSDAALSQKEIINLITGSSDLTEQSIVGSLSRDIDLYELGTSARSVFDLDDFFKNITKIDTLTVEPTFNIQTGAVEPTLIAKKNLSSRLSLLGEHSFGSNVTQSKVGAVFKLSSALNVLGVASTLSTKDHTALSVDLAYRVLASEGRFLKIYVSGNKEIDRAELLRSLKLNKNTRIKPNELESIEKGVARIYRQNGFWQCSAQVSCSSEGRYCRKIKIKITEGQAATIRSVLFEGDDPAVALKLDKLRPPQPGVRANEDLMQYADRLVALLRSEGYLSSRVIARYIEIPDSIEKDLVFNIFLGRPVTFIFIGNTKFKAEDFLGTINLFKRKQPFGGNTIKILVENIKRLYREAGYFFIDLTFEREDLNNGRTNYTIHINENGKIAVSEVKIIGNDRLALKQIRSALREQGETIMRSVLKPDILLTEQLQDNLQTLRDIYRKYGFPEAKVSYTLTQSEDNLSAQLEYLISEGQEYNVKWAEITGWPAQLQKPDEPIAPYSIPEANAYFNQLIEILLSHGYYSFEVNSRSAERNEIALEFKIESPTIISRIEISGTINTTPNIIEANLDFKTGDTWDSDKIRNSKGKILRLGLYNNVEIIPADGVLDSSMEVLLVNVSERELNSLEVGGGVNSELGLHFFGEATDRSLFLDGRSISLRLDSYYDQIQSDVSTGIAILRYSDPSFLASNYKFSGDIRYQKLDLSTQEFDLDRFSLSTFTYREWSERLTNVLGLTLLQENLDNVTPDAILSELDSGVVNLSFLSGSLTYDRRDHPFKPREGYVLGFEYKLASDLVWSDGNFYSTGGKFAWLWPLPFNERWSLSVQSHLASAWTYGSTEQIPITQRYYLGGRTSIRGFNENSLGPRGEEGAVLGGDTFFANNFEFRYLWREYTQFHLFYDLGSLSLRDEGSLNSELRDSIGVGFRYLSPIGPIGFDLGHPLDEKPGESSVRLHFSVGTSF